MKNMHTLKFISGVALLVALVLMGGCTNTPLTGSSPTPMATRPPTPPTLLPCDAQPADVVIAVTFTNDGCPIEAYPNNFAINGSDKFLCWVSADAAGNRARHEFHLYFDPLVGPSHNSGPHGLYRKKIDGTAPLTADGVEYKYTVVGDNCQSADPDDKYLDPRFWGRR